MKTIFDLPVNLIEEIISMVPLKSMREVRLTCKKWNTLSKSRGFTKMHISKIAAMTREGESRMIVLMGYKLYLKSFFFNGIDVDPSIKPKGKLICLNNSDQVKISTFFNCEGLLLCFLEDTFKLVVWNPYLGQTRWIQPRYFHLGQSGQYMDRCSYALGYENKKNKPCPSHKILRFTNHAYPNGRIFGTKFLWYEIYDFDSGLWTTLDMTLQWMIWHGVSHKGNTYFCARKISEDEYWGHITCFDFTREIFGPLLRLPFSAGHDDYVTLSCVREEKLAVLLTHNEVNLYEADIWITTEIEVEKVSWSKFLTLNTEPERPLSPTSFFIDEEKKVVMGFDVDDHGFNHHIISIVGEAGYLKQLNLGKRVDVSSRYREHMCCYVPSLVQIKQNHPEGKRKKQSGLETRRFNKKMWTLAAIEKPANERYELRPRKEKSEN